jgi:hypothetical protein
MDEAKQGGRNLGRVFDSRSDNLSETIFKTKNIFRSFIKSFVI